MPSGASGLEPHAQAQLRPSPAGCTGRPINFVSRWLGHASIHPTLIYLELVPDPTGSLASVP